RPRWSASHAESPCRSSACHSSKASPTADRNQRRAHGAHGLRVLLIPAECAPRRPTRTPPEITKQPESRGRALARTVRDCYAPAKKNVGLLRCDARRWHTSCPLRRGDLGTSHLQGSCV